MIDFGQPPITATPKEVYQARRKLEEATSLSAYTLGSSILMSAQAFLEQLKKMDVTPSENLVRAYLATIGATPYVHDGDVQYAMQHEMGNIKAMLDAKVSSYLEIIIEHVFTSTHHTYYRLRADNLMAAMEVEHMDSLITLLEAKNLNAEIDSLQLRLYDRLTEIISKFSGMSEGHQRDFGFSHFSKMEALQHGPKSKKVIEALQMLARRNDEGRRAVIRVLLLFLPSFKPEQCEDRNTCIEVLKYPRKPASYDRALTELELVMWPNLYFLWSNTGTAAKVKQESEGRYAFMRHLVKMELWSLFKSLSSRQAKEALGVPCEAPEPASCCC